MSNTAYYLLWLVAVLAASAIASAWITARLRWRVARRLQAARALDALTRYCDWVQAQRTAAFFQGAVQEAGAPLRELLVVNKAWLPELAGELAALLAAHARIVDYLWAQQALKLRDPEAWLESDHDGGFTVLWQEHLAAADALVRRLRLLDVGAVAGVGVRGGPSVGRTSAS